MTEPNPDVAPELILEAMTVVSDQLGRVAKLAHSQGVLNGLSMAQYQIDSYLKIMPDLDISSALSHLLILKSGLAQQATRIELNTDDDGNYHSDDEDTKGSE